MTDQSSRRAFLSAGAAGALIVKPQTVRGAQANSALTVGLIGAGRRGVAISGIFARNEFARIAAICDIYDDQLKLPDRSLQARASLRTSTRYWPAMWTRFTSPPRPIFTRSTSNWR